MSKQTKVLHYKTLPRLVARLRDDFKSGGNDFVLLFAYNGTGKTRLSMAFKDVGKKTRTRHFEEGAVESVSQVVSRDTLYFNAYTEDLFHWDNDLLNDSQRVLRINKDSHFFDGFRELALEEKIFPYLERYADFDFRIDYEAWTISFSRGDVEHIKVSRGEENIFIWCVFLALVELTIDAQPGQAYDWVKYLYIDDPISSLDDNNAIAVASDLAKLLRRGKDKVKTVISSHHGLFFNVMFNELKKQQTKSYFLYKSKDGEGHTLRATTDTPFFHHVAMLGELQAASQSGALYTHHFNTLRGILEKTANFFGHEDFSECLGISGDEGLHARALNLLSHGKYSLYEPREMLEDNKALFKEILDGFLTRYAFALPKLVPTVAQAQPAAAEVAP
ncbi:AAA family ATPase [Accumulibacter sp.]|uniref:AAA family ATPase n=1 Tax=Accumulibacter sp. TaxID=2053492 RepID=UPI001A5849EE|nr:AAA family ATPase [Accumulibacter sp.]MBL8400107.1 AAA family ATPase [Accumulibacter sp.]